MFNATTPEDLLGALGRVLRAAARADGPLDGFQRGQLLSASSIARNLAAEQAAARALLDGAVAEVGAALRAAPVDGAGAAAERLTGVRDGRELGAVLGDLLERLRADPAPAAARLRTQVHAAIRRLVDGEVAALAAGPPEGAAT